MSSANVVKALREIAVVRSSKDLSEAVKEQVIAEIKAKMNEAMQQISLPLGSQATNVKAK